MNAEEANALLGLAEEASPALRGSGATEALQRLETAHSELLAALAWFLEQDHPDEALRLGNALYRYWITKQAFAEGATWFDRVLAVPAGDPRLRALGHINAGFMPFWMGNDEDAARYFQRGLDLARELDDAPMTSQALGGLSRVALRTDVADGRRLAHEALVVSEDADDEAGRSNALHLLGVGAQIAGDLPEARTWMVQRLALVRESGNEFLVASEAANLSMVERQLGNLPVAEELAREALEIGRRIGDEFTRPFAIAGLAAIATERGDLNRAATLVGAAEAMMEAQQMAWPPDERPHYEHMLNVLPQAMGSDAFERARAAGRALTPEEAVRRALEESG